MALKNGFSGKFGYILPYPSSRKQLIRSIYVETANALDSRNIHIGVKTLCFQQSLYTYSRFLIFFQIIMNIHPAVVHFPVALLTLYSLLEIATLFGRERTKKLQQTKLFLLFVGTVGTYFALQSGELAQDYLGIKSELVETHEEYAEMTYSTYIGISIYYLLIIAKNNGLQRFLPQKRQEILTKILDRAYRRYFLILAATAGLILLTITGALGGAISQGPDADPMVQFIYNVLITP